MATAATSLLGLALPVTGELTGTWGDTVNNSITSLIDTAVAGTTTLSSDADVTLTTTTLASNQARQAIILWTAGGTVTRNITAPASSKAYVVINATSSTQSIVIRGVGPTTGVTIAAAEKALVAWNGTDFVKVSSSSVGTVTAVSVVSANGLAGSSSGGTTPALTLSTSITGVLKGNGTAISAAVAGTDYVTPTGTTTLTNKTIEAGTFTNGYTEEVFALGTSGSLALNPANGSIQTCVLAGNPTFTDSLAAGQSIVLMLENGASYTVIFPTTTWVSSTGNDAPTLTADDVLVFWKISTTLYGAYVGSFA